MTSNSTNVKLPLLTTRCHYQGRSRSASWSASISSNSRNVISPFLTTRCHYQGRSRSASWSANMSSNSRNEKLSFLTTRCHCWGVDLPLDLPIWALTVEISYCHSWPLDASTGGVDLPVDLPNMSSRAFRCAHHRGLFTSRKTNEDDWNSTINVSNLQHAILQQCEFTFHSTVMTDNDDWNIYSYVSSPPPQWSLTMKTETTV